MPAQPITRRRFLKVAGLSVAGVTLAGAGLTVAATQTPVIDYPTVTLEGATPMSKRILVTYATRAGSTAEIAAAIGESLAARGYAVDVKPVNEQPALAGYTAAIIGSAIRIGNWLPEAIEFVKTNQLTLSELPVALFTVHLRNTGDDEASQTARAAYLNAVQPLVPHAETVYFSGKMDFSRLSWLDRMIAKMVGAVETDERDWNQIRGWLPAGL